MVIQQILTGGPCWFSALISYFTHLFSEDELSSTETLLLSFTEHCSLGNITQGGMLVYVKVISVVL